MRDMVRQAPVLAEKGETWVRARAPIPVRMWVINARGDDELIRGWCTAWTHSLVWVEYVDRHGRESTVRWWARAAKRDDQTPPPPLPTPLRSLLDDDRRPILGGAGRGPYVQH